MTRATNIQNVERRELTVKEGKRALTAELNMRLDANFIYFIILFFKLFAGQ